MSIFDTHMGDFTLRMAHIPEREYTQGPCTPRGLQMWGFPGRSCAGAEMGIYLTFLGRVCNYRSSCKEQKSRRI